jgi:hypothetical protein
MSRFRTLLAIAAIGLAIPKANFSRAQTPQPAPPKLAMDPRIQSRLESLRPEAPRAYFELAEEVAELPSTTGDYRALARQLCSLSFELWRGSDARASDPRLGPSSLLLLATFAETENQARWIRTIAAAVDPEARTATAQAQEAVRDPVRDSTVLDLVSALELLRAGDGRRAAKLLEKPDVSQLLADNERLLSPAGVTGEGDRLRRLAREWPICPECRNRRSVRGPQGISICPSCGGDPGPPLSAVDVLFQLRFEASLLEGVQRSWVAQTLVDGGRPLRDLDPQEIALTFAVDPRKNVWREGGWVDPKAPAAAKEPAPIAKTETPPAPAGAPASPVPAPAPAPK